MQYLKSRYDIDVQKKLIYNRGQQTLFVPRPCRSVSQHNLWLFKTSDFDKSKFHFSPTVTLIRFARPGKRFDTSIAAGLQVRLQVNNSYVK